MNELPPRSESLIQQLQAEDAARHDLMDWATEKAERETPQESFQYVHASMITQCAAAAELAGLSAFLNSEYAELCADYGRKKLRIRLSIEVSTHSVGDAKRSLRAKVEKFLAELEGQR